MSNHQFDEQVVELVMTQLSLNHALKTWGKEAHQAVDAEMKQLHWCESFKPVRWEDLTKTQMQMILESHIFVTKKRTGELKACQVAGGNKQCNFISKE